MILAGKLSGRPVVQKFNWEANGCTFFFFLLRGSKNPDQAELLLCI